MADPELVKTLDYILNRCDAAAIEAVAAAVVRRKRDLAMYGSAGLADPRSWAKQTARNLNTDMGLNLNDIRGTVRDMAAEMLRKEAPELSDGQIDELLREWVGGDKARGGADEQGAAGLPRNALTGMVDQFVAYSKGLLPEGEERVLRSEMADWPARYWRSFPAVVKRLISAHLAAELDEAEFRGRLMAALDLRGEKKT